MTTAPEPPSGDQAESGGDRGTVFVVTYGRSGSTLLMGILNSIPGYLIRGENRDAVYQLFRFHQTLAQEKARVNRRRTRESTHPFFGIGDVPLERSVRQCRRLILSTILRPDDETRVVGFKEIRWYQPDLEEYVAWLRELFPAAKFLINTRNHEDVLKSGWWASGDHTLDLVQLESRLLALAEGLGPAAYHVRYDDYVNEPRALMGMFAWLGEEYDEATIRSVLSVKHSY